MNNFLKFRLYSKTLLWVSLLSVASLQVTPDMAISDPLQLQGSEAGITFALHCEFTLTMNANEEVPNGTLCSTNSSNNSNSEDDRSYLVETARPGTTMTWQGVEVAIDRLHPEFVHRLARAIREARNAGLPFAGIFSAYRPPVFGIGGFADKFNSLHSYGLAVDMVGIGVPGSDQAKLWHQIANRHGLSCPYGPLNRTEWNHCQPTRVKIILGDHPLRETISAKGPISLQDMFEVGNSLIEEVESVGIANTSSPATASVERHFPPQVVWRMDEAVSSTNLHKRRAAVDANQSGLRNPPSWCWHLNRPQQDKCGVANLASWRLIHESTSSKTRNPAVQSRSTNYRMGRHRHSLRCFEGSPSQRRSRCSPNQIVATSHLMSAA
jgi:hypothetical protein